MKQVHDRRRWTANPYRRVAEPGILAADDRVERIDGKVVDAPIGPVRARAVRAITQLPDATVPPDRARIAVQDPLGRDARDEPQPDVMRPRPRADGCRAVPTPARPTCSS
jgi:hypothetical protein